MSLQIFSLSVYISDSSYVKGLRGVSLKVFNSSEPDAVGDLCYQDTSGDGDTPLSNVTLTDCSSGSIIRLYNSRNTAQDDKVYSIYAQLLITEVQVLADKGKRFCSYIVTGNGIVLYYIVFMSDQRSFHTFTYIVGIILWVCICTSTTVCVGCLGIGVLMGVCVCVSIQFGFKSCSVQACM